MLSRKKSTILAASLFSAVFGLQAAKAVNLVEKPLSVERTSPTGAVNFDDSFDLFVTYDADETPVVSTGINPNTGQPYTFTGYTILNVRGKYVDPTAEVYPIPFQTPTPAGSVQRNPSGGPAGINDLVTEFPTTATTYQSFWALGALGDPSNKYPADLTLHNNTDNLFNPNGGFAAGDLPSSRPNGVVSFGGLQFFVDYGSGYVADGYPNRYMPYQFFFLGQSADGFEYGGCPGDCGNAIIVPGPLPIFGVASAFGFARTIRRRQKFAIEHSIEA